MKRSHFLMIVLITIFVSLGAVSCGVFGGEEEATEDTTTQVEEAAVEEAVAEEAVAEEAVAEEAVAEEAVAEEAVAEEVVAEEAVAEEAVAEEAVTEEAVDDAPAEEAVAADGAVGGVEGDEGVGGGVGDSATAPEATAPEAVAPAAEAGDPTADQVAVDPNAGGGSVESAEAAAAPAATTATATPPPPPPTPAPPVDITNCEPPNVPVPTGAYYVVKPCDNLYRIGLSYGLSWTVIAQANGIYYPDRIWIGQTLYIPGQPVTAPPQPMPPYCTTPTYPIPTGSSYLVQPCDNLFRIGLAYGLSWPVIAQANGIYYPYHVMAGQVLYIPYQPY